jgi:hypothetical protein
MALLIEMTNARTGARRVLYDESGEVGVSGSYRDVLEPHFYFGTILVAVRLARPGMDRQLFFDVFAAQCGGTWRQVRADLWLHVERK